MKIIGFVVLLWRLLLSLAPTSAFTPTSACAPTSAFTPTSACAPTFACVHFLCWRASACAHSLCWYAPTFACAPTFAPTVASAPTFASAPTSTLLCRCSFCCICSNMRSFFFDFHYRAAYIWCRPMIIGQCVQYKIPTVGTHSRRIYTTLQCFAVFREIGCVITNICDRCTMKQVLHAILQYKMCVGLFLYKCVKLMWFSTYMTRLI